MVVQFPSGSVKFSTISMPDCCGMTVIHNIIFWPHKHRKYKALYKDFHKHLIESDDPWTTRLLSRGKLIITDALHGEDRTGPCPARFCRAMGWDEIGTPTYNYNSGRHVTMFEWNRTPKK